MKAIKALLPLDTSEFSRQALEVAVKTLNAETTHISLLRVSPQPELPVGQPTAPVVHGAVLSAKDLSLRQSQVQNEPYPIYLDELRASIEADVKRGLAKDLSALEAKGFSVDSCVRFGEAAQEIIKEAKRGYDMILMATHGRSGLRRVLMGSVAEKVMRNVEIPVMMFKPEAS